MFGRDIVDQLACSSAVLCEKFSGKNPSNPFAFIFTSALTTQSWQQRRNVKMLLSTETDNSTGLIGSHLVNDTIVPNHSRQVTAKLTSEWSLPSPTVYQSLRTIVLENQDPKASTKLLVYQESLRYGSEIWTSYQALEKYNKCCLRRILLFHRLDEQTSISVSVIILSQLFWAASHAQHQTSKTGTLFQTLS